LKVTKDSVKRVAAGLAAVATMSTAAVLGSAAPASAAGSGWLDICSYGDYSSYVEFPAHNSASRIAPRGGCISVNVGTSGTVETIVIIGITSKNEYFWVQNGSLRPSRGGNVITYGSKNDHWALTPAV